MGLATRRVAGQSVGSLLRSRGWDLEQVKYLPAAVDLYGGFFVDILLANWDVIGLTGDNLVVNATGIFRIDPGGAMTFRAQGDRKGKAFGTFPTELTTMKDPLVGTAGQVFAHMTPADMDHAAPLFRQMPWPTLDKLLKSVRQQTQAVADELTERYRPALADALDREFAEIATKLESRFAVILEQLR
jgi:hypothetical protein